MKTKFNYLLLSFAIIASCSDDEVKSSCSGDVPHATVQMNGYNAVATWAPVTGNTYQYKIALKSDEIPSLSMIAESPNTIIYTFMPASDYAFYLSSEVKDASGSTKTSCPDKDPIYFNTGCFTADRFLLRAEAITSTSVTLFWGDRSSGATFDKTDKKHWSPLTKFTVNFRKQGTTSSEVYGTDDHFYDIANLTPKTGYEMQLVYVCTDGKTYMTEWNTFTTL